MSSIQAINQIHPLNQGGIFSVDEIMYLMSTNSIAPTQGMIGFGAMGSNLSPSIAGSNIFPRLPVTIQTNTPAKVFGGNGSGYSTSTCAVIDNNGVAYTWGANSLNSLGRTVNATTAPSNVPCPLAATSGSNVWINMRTGQYWGGGVQSDGTLWTWGYSASYRTGQGNTNNLTVPTKVGTANTWSDVFAFDDTGFATRTDGTLWSWGNNSGFTSGQGTGTGSTTVPTQVGTSTDWLGARLSGNNGSNTIIAVKSNGTLWALGNRLNGVTGDGAASGTYQNWTQVGSDTDWNGVVSFTGATVLRKSDGRLYGTGNRSKFSGTNGSFLTPQLIFDGVANSFDFSGLGGTLCLMVIDNQGNLWAGGSAAEIPPYLPGYASGGITDMARVAVLPSNAKVTANSGATLIYF